MVYTLKGNEIVLNTKGVNHKPQISKSQAIIQHSKPVPIAIGTQKLIRKFL